MNKRIFVVIIIFICFPLLVSAKRGCCSHHGGVCGCSGGRNLCCDGTISPSCTCQGGSNTSKKSSSTTKTVYGCTDKKANNYNSKANKNDGSCKYDVYGCMDSKAINYKKEANKSDGSCLYEVLGCTDKRALNYNSKANKNDGSCEYTKGCTDEKAINYNKDAIIDDHSCNYETFENENDDLNNNGIIDEESNATDEIFDGYIEEEKDEIIENKNDEVKENSKENSDLSSNPTDTLIPIGVLGGGGYYIYNKFKGKKK